MSDILGAMDFTLNETHPATVVNVTVGEKIYYLSNRRRL